MALHYAIQEKGVVMAAITNKDIKFLARELKDFDLYDAAFGADEAWAYLENLAKSDIPVIKEWVAEHRTAKKAIDDNAKRFRTCKRHIESDISEDFVKLYEDEIAILTKICYLSLADLIEVLYPAEWEKLLKSQEEEIKKRAEKKAKKEAEKAAE